MKVNLTSAWNFPTRVITGAGRIADLPATCKAHGIAKPLVVTDRGLAASGLVAVPVMLQRIMDLPAGTRALKRAGWRATDLDAIELNEAFAAQSIACIRGLELDPERERSERSGNLVGRIDAEKDVERRRHPGDDLGARFEALRIDFAGVVDEERAGRIGGLLRAEERPDDRCRLLHRGPDAPEEHV